MNNFFCALRIDGSPVTKTELFAQIVRLPRQLEWQTVLNGAFAGLALKNTRHPLISRGRGFTAVGDVRLDNRGELLALLGDVDPAATDLDVVAAALDRRGAQIVPRILGDFSFVFWDARAQKIIAARDAFGVRPLYYRRSQDYLLIASRLAALVGAEELDKDYLADMLVGLPSPSPRTVWSGTFAVEPGSLLVQRGSVTAQSRYWDAAAIEPTARIAERDAVEQFRRLFFHAVDQRAGDDGAVWAQLSGGLDSSAVVCAAERQRASHERSRLGGTVTVVDSLGDGDETAFSNAVIAAHPLRNEQIRDYWPWRDDLQSGPPITDEPSPLFPFYLRDQRTVDVVRQAGARVLLSGLGSDHYLHGTLNYMADMVAQGRVRQAMHEALGWAIATRRSFWSTAHYNALQPLIGLTGIRRRRASVPRWINDRFAGMHGVEQRIVEANFPTARFGKMYVTHTATELRRVANWVQRGPFEDQLDMRYPFLHRPLVEFALSLPVHMKVRPGTHKWILREAMRGILPEKVRTRTSKGGMDARIFWTLQHEGALINELLRDPMLGQLGCINVDVLRKMVDVARQGEYHHTVHLFSVLSLETWLRARFGAWPVARTAQTAA
ncbi:MAG TPA: asparagine synthase-related protein [Longimicrobiales bacterium]